MIPVISAGRWLALRSLLIGMASTSARLRQNAPASCVALASPATLKPAAITVRKLRPVTLDRDGGVTLLIGSQSTGQGHATSYAQLIAERLDLPPDRVRVVQGDTDAIKSGAGTGGIKFYSGRRRFSRPRSEESSPNKSKRLRPRRWKPQRVTLEIVNGTVRVAGTDRVISFADLATHPGALLTNYVPSKSSVSSRRPSPASWPASAGSPAGSTSASAWPPRSPAATGSPRDLRPGRPDPPSRSHS